MTSQYPLTTSIATISSVPKRKVSISISLLKWIQYIPVPIFSSLHLPCLYIPNSYPLYRHAHRPQNTSTPWSLSFLLMAGIPNPNTCTRLPTLYTSPEYWYIPYPEYQYIPSPAVSFIANVIFQISVVRLGGFISNWAIISFYIPCPLLMALLGCLIKLLLWKSFGSKVEKFGLVGQRNVILNLF